MKIGLDLVNWKRVPSDSTIHVAGRNIKKVLITVDVSAADLLFGKESWMRCSYCTSSIRNFCTDIFQGF